MDGDYVVCLLACGLQIVSHEMREWPVCQIKSNNMHTTVFFFHYSGKYSLKIVNYWEGFFIFYKVSLVA